MITLKTSPSCINQNQCFLGKHPQTVKSTTCKILFLQSVCYWYNFLWLTFFSPYNIWKKFFIKVNCWFALCLGVTLLLFLIQVFGKKIIFYINLQNDGVKLTAKLRKNWLHIIIVKFPELIIFLIAFYDCSPFVFVNFFNKKAIQNLSRTMLLANMCQKIIL